MDDPITGPIPREKFKEIASCPGAGKAREAIQQYDPLWGRQPGEKLEWKVRVERTGADRGTAYVKAAPQKEADDLADNLSSCEVDWDYADDDFDIISVEPCKPRARFG